MSLQSIITFQSLCILMLLDPLIEIKKVLNQAQKLEFTMANCIIFLFLFGFFFKTCDFGIFPRDRVLWLFYVWVQINRVFFSSSFKIQLTTRCLVFQPRRSGPQWRKRFISKLIWRKALQTSISFYCLRILKI